MYSKLAKLLGDLPRAGVMVPMKIFNDKVKRSLDFMIDKIKRFADE